MPWLELSALAAGLHFALAWLRDDTSAEPLRDLRAAATAAGTAAVASSPSGYRGGEPEELASSLFGRWADWLGPFLHAELDNQ